jgi:AraC-like DNA-binding protein
MADHQAGRVPVSELRVATTTAAETVEFINETYVGARIRLGGRGDDFRHELTGHATPSLQVASFWYTRGLSLDTDPFGYLMAVAVTSGGGEVRAEREQAAGGAGTVFLLYPPVCPLRVRWGDGFAANLLTMPLEQVERLAAEQAGAAGAGVRFTSMQPVSAAMARLWRKTMDFTASQLDGPDPAAASPLVEQAIAAMAAAAALMVFPNTTMSPGYLPGPGWAGPPALRRAVAYIDGHAHEPVTLTQVAEASGASAQELRHAFARHYSVTPSGYLRRVRLERAHAELRAADPRQGITVAGIARTWGWASPSQFAAAYRRRFGVPPGSTLRA